MRPGYWPVMQTKIQYHHYGKLTGDYDGLENETAVIALLHDK